MRVKTIGKAALLAVVLLAAFTPVTHAAAITPDPLCTGLISSNIFSGHTPAAQSILTISLLIMLVMFFVSGVLYGLGYAFRIDKLLRFARNEIAEVLLTGLIVLLFVGTFTIMGTAVGAHNLFALGGGTLNDNVFLSDCTLLSQDSFSLIGPIVGVGFQGVLLSFWGSLKVGLAPNFFGVTFSPLGGYTILVPIINLLIYTGSGFMAVLLGSTIFLSLIYSLFPLFLYLGIILRTVPWTRPAGGAFLGLFIAFYAAFPLLMYYMLVAYAPAETAPGLTMASNPASVGTPVTITASCLALAVPDQCEILINDAQVKQGSGTITYAYDPPGSGCYQVAAVDLTNGHATAQTLTVNPTSQCQGINTALS